MKTITMTADVPSSMTPDDIMDAAYGAGFTGVALGIPQDDNETTDERQAEIEADNALVDRAVARFAASQRR